MHTIAYVWLLHLFGKRYAEKEKDWFLVHAQVDYFSLPYHTLTHTDTHSLSHSLSKEFCDSELPDEWTYCIDFKVLMTVLSCVASTAASHVGGLP